MFYKIRDYIRKHFIGYRPSDMPCIDYLESKGERTMKIIDLLNKIAKGEELPEKILYSDKLWYWDTRENDYVKDANKLFYYYLDDCLIISLNDEVEIIEDTPKISKLYINNKLQYDLAPKEDKKIEKLSILTYSDLIDMTLEELVDVIKEQRFKINEIIDCLNEERE